jgi:hypothetical protein
VSPKRTPPQPSGAGRAGQDPERIPTRNTATLPELLPACGGESDSPHPPGCPVSGSPRSRPELIPTGYESDSHPRRVCPVSGSTRSRPRWTAPPSDRCRIVGQTSSFVRLYLAINCTNRDFWLLWGVFAVKCRCAVIKGGFFILFRLPPPLWSAPPRLSVVLCSSLPVICLHRYACASVFRTDTAQRLAFVSAAKC